MIETDKLAAVDRLIAPNSKSAQEEALERALRPKRLADYTGQVKIREQLEIFIQAARKRGDSLDHVLLFGPPGPELFPWFYDKKLWTEYLDFLVANRMNTLYLWNGHPFASLVRLKDYPYAVEVPDDVFQKNQEQYRWLAQECDKRGIWLVQMFYNIFVSKPFAETNHISTQLSAPTPLVADYTRKSIAEFVKDFPNVGLMVCLGEALQGTGTDPGAQDRANHLRHRRLAVAAGHRDQRQIEAPAPRRGKRAERGVAVGHEQSGQSGLGEAALGKRCGGTCLACLGEEIMRVVALAAQRDEQIACAQAAGVRMNAGYRDPPVADEARLRHRRAQHRVRLGERHHAAPPVDRAGRNALPSALRRIRPLRSPLRGAPLSRLMRRLPSRALRGARRRYRHR